jgi:diguanylate cyclase (GGDEF)-like protein/PAS domain S-box-containing protein
MKQTVGGQWSVERAVLLGFAFALTILFVIGVVSYRTTTKLIDTAGWVNHTHRMMEVLADVQGRLREIQSAEHGYLLTGGSDYRSAAETAATEVARSLEWLEGNMADAGQRQRLHALEPLVARSLANMREVVSPGLDRGLEEAQRRLNAASDLQLTADVQATLREMRVAEEILLGTREAAARGSARQLINTLVVGTSLAVLLILSAGIFIRTGMKERARGEAALRESQKLMRDFLDNASDLIYSVDQDGHLVFVNRTWRETLGYDDAELESITLSDIVHPDRREHFLRLGSQVLEGTAADPFETVFVTRRGEEVTVHGRVSARFEEGRAVAVRGIFQDITRSKRAELELQRSNDVLLKSVTELEQRTREIARLGDMGDLLQSCQSVEEAYRVLAQSVPQIIAADGGALGITSPSRNLVEIVATWGSIDRGAQVFVPDDCWALRRGRINIVEDPDSALRCRHVETGADTAYVCVPLVAQGEALGILSLAFGGSPAESRLRLTPARQRLIGTVADRIALAIANLKLRAALLHQSVRDPLTGLFNRRYMEESLERELRRASRSERPLGVLMLDLDHFKRFNDSFGHDAGDAMLREFSNMLRSNVRGGDIACRYGGEEFALILPEASLEITRQRADLLREKAKHLDVQHRGLSLGGITISVGVAGFPGNGDDSATILQAADTALYAAKTTGRDRVSVAPHPPAGGPDS